MKLSLETMQNISQANLHTMSSENENIAGMVCRRLSNGEPLQLGDIVYGYYSQTDGFTIYDVIELTDTHAVMQTIDADCMFEEEQEKLSNTLLIAGPTRFDTFYRPNPEDRKRIENEGFDSASFSRFGGNRIKKRKLAIKIYPTPGVSKKDKDNSGILMLLLALVTVMGIILIKF